MYLYKKKVYVYVSVVDCEFRCREPENTSSRGKHDYILYSTVLLRVTFKHTHTRRSRYGEWISQRVPFLFLRGLVWSWLGLAAAIVACALTVRGLFPSANHCWPVRRLCLPKLHCYVGIQCAISFRKYCILRPRTRTPPKHVSFHDHQLFIHKVFFYEQKKILTRTLEDGDNIRRLKMLK